MLQSFLTLGAVQILHSHIIIVLEVRELDVGHADFLSLIDERGPLHEEVHRSHGSSALPP